MVTGPSRLVAEVNYQKASTIFHALKDPDVLKLFNASANGFVSGKDTIRRLQLTPRKYYSCLKELSNLALIESRGKSFSLTPLGRILHQIVFNDILPFISPETKPPDAFAIMRLRYELSLIDNYPDTVRLMVNAIEHAENSVSFAVKYVDLAVMQSILSAAGRGVKTKIITDPTIDSANLFKLLIASAKSIRGKVYQPTLDPMSLRTREITASLLVVDERTAIFEFPTREFKMAFFTRESKPVRALSEYFEELWGRL
ncbi:MAG: hypothetical protein QXF26_00510 [Candidatus Bathyarchaeia archaeon]